jgi:hypothetical protein
MDWAWLVEHAASMFTPKIDKENLMEMQGIADGKTAAGHPSSPDEILTIMVTSS